MDLWVILAIGCFCWRKYLTGHTLLKDVFFTLPLSFQAVSFFLEQYCFANTLCHDVLPHHRLIVVEQAWTETSEAIFLLVFLLGILSQQWKRNMKCEYMKKS
jgi:hypothetical protein